MTSKRVWFVTFALLWSSATPFGQAMNTLTAPERAQGWQLLFDGKTLAGSHVSVPAPAAGRTGPAPSPQPGQVGTPKPCIGSRPAAEVPAGASHWEVADGLLTACGEPTG